MSLRVLSLYGITGLDFSVDIAESTTPSDAVTGAAGFATKVNEPGNYVDMNSQAGVSVTTPDASKLDIAGDMTIIVCIQFPTYLNASQQKPICSKYVATGNQRSWKLELLSTGIVAGGGLNWQHSSTGNPGTNHFSTVGLTSVISDGAKVYIKVEFDADNGASGHDVKYFWSTDYDPVRKTGTWTQLGATVTTAGVASIFNSTSPLQVGINCENNEGLGKFYFFEMYAGIGGSDVRARMNPDEAAGLDATTIPSPETAETWTLNNGAVLKTDGPAVDSLPAPAMGFATHIVEAENLVPWSEGFENWGGAAAVAQNAFNDPEGAPTIDTLTDNSAAAFQNRSLQITVPDDKATYQIQCLIRKDAAATQRAGFNLNLTGGSVGVNLNPRWSLDGTNNPFGVLSSYDTNYWLFTAEIVNNQTGNTTLNIGVYPATATTKTGADDVAAVGSMSLGWFRVQRSSTPQAYKPTFGTAEPNAGAEDSQSAAFDFATVVSEGPVHFSLPGEAGNYADTPDSAAQDIAGDWEVEVDFALDGDQTGTPALLSRIYPGSTSAVSYVVALNQGGASSGADTRKPYVGMFVSPTWYWAISPTALTPGRKYNAKGRHQGTSLILLIDDVQVALNSSVPAATPSNTTGTRVGRRWDLDHCFRGKIYKAVLRDGIGGTDVLTFDPAKDGTPGATTMTSSATGEQWTIHQNGEDKAQLVGQTGQIAEVVSETIDYVTALAEGGEVADVLTVTVDFSTTLAESSPAVDVVEGERIVHLIEAVSVQDLVDEWVTFVTALAENLVPVDVFNEAKTVNTGLVEGEAYISLPGRALNRVKTPSTPENTITGDIEVVFGGTLKRWHVLASEPWQALVAKRITGDIGFLLGVVSHVTDGGKLAFRWTTNGTGPVMGPFSSVAVPFSDDTEGYVRLTLDVDNGASQWVANFEYSTDQGQSWNPLGTAQVGAGPTSIWGSSTDLEVGAYEAGGSDFWEGEVKLAQVRDGIGGTLVAELDTDRDAIPGKTKITSANGEVWEVTQDGTPQAEVLGRGDIADSMTAQLVASGRLREFLAPADQVTGAASFATKLADGLVLLDSVSAVAQFLATLDESGAAQDVIDGERLVVGVLLEAGAAVEVVNGEVIVHLREYIYDIADTIDSTVDWAVVLAEGLVVTDIITGTKAVYGLGTVKIKPRQGNSVTIETRAAGTSVTSSAGNTLDLTLKP